MKVRVQVDTETFVRFWLVVIAFGIAGLLVYSARAGLILLGTALFLALALNGPVTRLAKHLPGKSRVGSTAIAYLVVITLTGSFIFLAVPPIVEQTVRFVQTVPGLVDNATTSWHSLDSAIDRYNLRPQVDEALASLRDNASNWASVIGSNVLAGATTLLGIFTSAFLVLVLTFLMLVEGPEWMKRLWGLYTNQEKMERHRRIVSRMVGIVSGFVTGQLTVSAIGAVFAGIAVFIISLIFQGVPANLALPTAAIYFIFSLIPMFGSTISAVIVAVLLAFNAAWAAVAYTVFFLIYQQIENNFISPSIQSRKLELSPLMILAAVTVGVYMFGIVGGIISIPIAGCIKVLMEEYLDYARAKRNRLPADKHDTKLTKEKV